MRHRYFVAGFLAIILSAATAWATSQLVMVDPVTPTVLAGDEVGFRVKGLRAGRPVGAVVVRVNGEWVEVELEGPGPTPFTYRQPDRR